MSGAGLAVSTGPSSAKKPLIDLREWKSQRVLARRGHAFEVSVGGFHRNLIVDMYNLLQVGNIKLCLKNTL